jgi:DNA (cytosine-5)-methyltransferase 1
VNGMALCAGVGMLDEGAKAAVEFLGGEYRTICYVERDSFAAACLVARMEDAALEPAPIWDDLSTFDGRAWRGLVDCIAAGFPCQPWSQAGKGEGIGDERWIWPDIAQIVRDAEPSLVFLENVPGLVSGGGLHFVLDDLAQMGFDAQWGHFAARAVGANHQRERVFILAHAGLQSRELFERAQRISEHARGGDGLGNAQCDGGRIDQPRRGSDRGGATGGTGSAMADAECSGSQGPRSGKPRRRRIAAPGDQPLADLFAPGPGDAERWRQILESQPQLAPAIKPGFRLLADGLALVVDEARADQLRCSGNGVVALQSAAAFVVLARRAGLIPKGTNDEI